MKKLLPLFCFLILAPRMNAQSLDSTLTNLAGSFAQSYLGPITSAFGSNLNAGWFHKAPSAKMFGFDLEFGAVGMGTFFADVNKNFSASGDFKFNQDEAKALTNFVQDPNYGSPALGPSGSVQRNALQDSLMKYVQGVTFTVGISGPTIVGSETDSVRISFNGAVINTNFGGTSRSDTIPAQSIPTSLTGYLKDISFLPLGAPQLSIGTFVGTQFTFRYLPSIEISSDLGKFSYFGFGLQHNPGLWLANPLPIDISASFFTQTLKVGEIFESKATAFGINVSKRFGPGALNITPYAGFLIENSKTTVTFTYNEPKPQSLGGGYLQNKLILEFVGENKSRLTLGLSLKLIFLNINADYNLGKYNSASAGLMFII